jgi:hypothetical protein
MRLRRGIALALLLSSVPCLAGDRSNYERAGGVAASFAPPITPALSGSPGADKYLQSNGAGVVSWAAQTAWRERISNGQCVSNPSGGTAADSV